jgi:hypothetical protein
MLFDVLSNVAPQDALFEKLLAALGFRYLLKCQFVWYDDSLSSLYDKIQMEMEMAQNESNLMN